MAEEKKYLVEVHPVPSSFRTSPTRTTTAMSSYTITIKENIGSVPAQLVSRHRIITDANSAVQEVRPRCRRTPAPCSSLAKASEYTSGCDDDTRRDDEGIHQMVAEDGTQFAVTIPEFTLAIPRVLH